MLQVSLQLCEVDSAVDRAIGKEESSFHFVVVDDEPKNSIRVVAFEDVVLRIVLPVQRSHRNLFAIHDLAAGAGKPVRSCRGLRETIDVCFVVASAVLEEAFRISSPCA